mmetsp:Transcript_63728/g.137021  ORF Transcript_63728/g.137021 Transcript_63728/m.137021 type:complete len:496 (-) Transcript_63728:1035-2522(-)
MFAHSVQQDHELHQRLYRVRVMLPEQCLKGVQDSAAKRGRLLIFPRGLEVFHESAKCLQRQLSVNLLSHRSASTLRCCLLVERWRGGVAELPHFLLETHRIEQCHELLEAAQRLRVRGPQVLCGGLVSAAAEWHGLVISSASKEGVGEDADRLQGLRMALAQGLLPARQGVATEGRRSAAAAGATAITAEHLSEIADCLQGMAVLGAQHRLEPLHDALVERLHLVVLINVDQQSCHEAIRLECARVAGPQNLLPALPCALVEFQSLRRPPCGVQQPGVVAEALQRVRVQLSQYSLSALQNGFVEAFGLLEIPRSGQHTRQIAHRGECVRVVGAQQALEDPQSAAVHDYGLLVLPHGVKQSSEVVVGLQGVRVVCAHQVPSLLSSTAAEGQGLIIPPHGMESGSKVVHRLQDSRAGAAQQLLARLESLAVEMLSLVHRPCRLQQHREVVASTQGIGVRLDAKYLLRSLPTQALHALSRGHYLAWGTIAAEPGSPLL